MSAYLVNDDTLDLLSSFIAQWSQDSHMGGLDFYLDENVLPPRVEGFEIEVSPYGRRVSISNPRAVKTELLAENIASLWGRYPAGRGGGLESAESMVGERSPFKYVNRDEATLEQVAGALHCYEYQACETDEWKNSFAHALCQATRRKITSIMSDTHWEFDRV